MLPMKPMSFFESLGRAPLQFLGAVWYPSQKAMLKALTTADEGTMELSCLK